MKGALLMISLNSINTVCTSSKWSQNKQTIAKKNVGGTPPKSASGTIESLLILCTFSGQPYRFDSCEPV